MVRRLYLRKIEALSQHFCLEGRMATAAFASVAMRVERVHTLILAETIRQWDVATHSPLSENVRRVVR